MRGTRDIDFRKVMADRTKAQLLMVLQESHDYVPEAVIAAQEELQRRGVNGFDIAEAIDLGESYALTSKELAGISLTNKERILWLLLPFLVMTPWGPRQFRKYANHGYRRKSIEFLEVAFIGFSLYLLGIIGLTRLIGI